MRRNSTTSCSSRCAHPTAEVPMSLGHEAQPGITEQGINLTPHVHVPSARSMNARTLAALAEHAHRLKGTPLALVETADASVVLKDKSEVSPTDRVIFDVDTARHAPDRLEFERVVVKAEGCE